MSELYYNVSVTDDDDGDHGGGCVMNDFFGQYTVRFVSLLVLVLNMALEMRSRKKFSGHATNRRKSSRDRRTQ